MCDNTPMVIRRPGLLVARGNTSEVYEWGHGAVVKVLRAGIPREWAERESTTSELVHAAGLPAPAVLDVVTVNSRVGIVFERVEGISMWDQMLADPAGASTLIRLLVKLQAEVNASCAPSGLPKVCDRLRQNIDAAAMLTDVEKTAARGSLECLPDGNSLCHFDVHPNNVLLGRTGPVIIDWFDAAVGDPAADVVRSSVLLRHDAVAGHLGGASSSIVAELHDEYVASVVAARDLGEEVLLGWEPCVLAGRLAEPLPVDALLATRDAFNALERDAESSVLALALRSAMGGS
jgi:aminoglycoside phosphotransferase (APT) family kinase protein